MYPRESYIQGLASNEIEIHASHLVVCDKLLCQLIPMLAN